MNNLLKKSALSLAITTCLAASGAAYANDTSSSIKGKITGPQGNPAIDTTVTILHVPSGTTKTITVNNAGLFTAKGLRVGGPYKITVDSDTFEDTVVNDVFLTLGDAYPVKLALQTESDIESITISGRPISANAGGTGPSTNFTLADLENSPAINRDFKDIVRSDPRVYVDESGGDDAIQCGGGNPKFNSLTLDGVRMNDNFGLNRNGYPTVRVPFSYDAIDQVAVELAPFDVKYGGFTACNFNAVTKSGDNEISGSVFMDYTNDSLKGDEIEGETQPMDEFSEKRYGFSVGLPLIKDELFIFTSYEKLEGVELFSYTPLNKNISSADLTRITDIARDVYDYDAGDTPATMPVEDEKLLIKLDWNINDDHRASLVYNHNDGYRLDQSDSGSSRLALSSHFYERGAELNSLVASLYSNWSDNFSTEMRLSKSKLDARQVSLDAASGFGEMQISHEGATVYIGPDDSRQSNDLDYDTTTFKLAGNYYLDQHTITAGYEYEKLNVFNLFMQHTQGEFRFYSIEDFENGQAARVYYNNSSGTNNPNDNAASFGYAQHTLYLQDEFTNDNGDLEVTYGLRYDMYTSDDTPNYNASFHDRYGFSNQKNMDGLSLLQPRLGFIWSASDALEVRGGLGLYAGGNPNVWVSNAYSNDGVTQIGLKEYSVDLFNTPMTNGGAPGYEIPQSMYDDIANSPIGAGDGSVNAIDPNFKVPSNWKYALGATYTNDNDYIFSLDLLHSRGQNSATIKDISLQKSAETAPDGRPLYEAVEFTDESGDTHTRYSEYLLTNVKSGDAISTVLSAAMSKNFYGIDTTLSYAFTHSTDSNPMTSSVSGSNYGNLAVTDPGNPGRGISNYEIPHRFTAKLSYALEILPGYKTRFSLLGQASEGRPYSYTFEKSDRAFGDNNWNGSRQLMYVPLENDPNVVYGEDFDVAAFNQFIADKGLTRGEIIDRNAFNADWWVKFDVKVSQQLPAFHKDHKAKAYLTIKNVGNLLNSDWGVLKQGAFVGNRMVRTSINDEGQYEYTRFNAHNAEQDNVINASLWQLRMGISYKF